jgi:uncharacterized protein DUF4158
MPVEFLTEQQRQRYGTYTAEPSDAQLASYFYLDDTDRERLATKRGNHHRLGFALQVCTVRFLSTFLVDPTLVPSGAVRHVAKQLGIEDDPAPLLAQYATAWQAREHSREIQRLYEYRDFAEQPQHFQLIRWLYTHAWLTAERPIVLFDLVTKRLVERRVLLPGVSVLERLVASVRDHAANRLWRRLAGLPTAPQRFLLEDLVRAIEIYPLQKESAVTYLVATRRAAKKAWQFYRSLSPRNTARIQPWRTISKLQDFDRQIAELTLSILSDQIQDQVQIHLIIRDLFPKVLNTFEDLTGQLKALNERCGSG